MRRVIDQHDFAARRQNLVNDARGGGDDVHVVLAPEPFLDDLHVEQPEKTAAITEAERNGTFRLVNEGGVVHPQLADRGFQVLEIGGVDRVNSAENHRVNFLETGQRLFRRMALIGHGVADLQLRSRLDVGDDVAHVARLEFRPGEHLRSKDAHLLHFVTRVGAHHLDVLIGLDFARENADIGNHTAVNVKNRIEDEGTQDVVLRFRRRRDPVDHGLENLVDPDAHFRAAIDRFLGGNGEDFLELAMYRGEIGVRQVDLIDHRHDRQALFVGEVHVRNRLRLDALGRVHNEERAFTGCETARDFIGKIDVTWCIEQVEVVFLAVLGRVTHCHRMRLDRDPPFPLQIHRIEELILFLAVVDRAGALEQSIRQGCFAMIDMRDDAEIAGQLDRHEGAHYAGVPRDGQRTRPCDGTATTHSVCHPDPPKDGVGLLKLCDSR